MHRWSTADCPVTEQSLQWRNAIRQSCAPLFIDSPAQHLAAPVVGSVSAHTLISTTWVEIDATNSHVLANRPAPASSVIPSWAAGHVIVVLQLTGQCYGTYGGRDVHLAPDMFAVFDTADEFRLQLSSTLPRHRWRVLVLRMQRAHVAPLMLMPGTTLGARRDGNTGGIATLAVSTMLALWSNIEYLDRSTAHAAESALMSVLAAATADPDLPPSRQDGLDEMRVAINRYLSANLHSTTLSAAAVARRFGISVRKLHQIYAHCDRSFAQTVMALRVEQCAREIATANEQLPLAQIAARWGFCDQSHLNRVFRSEYGCLPSEFRRLHARLPQPGTAS